MNKRKVRVHEQLRSPQEIELQPLISPSTATPYLCRRRRCRSRIRRRDSVSSLSRGVDYTEMMRDEAFPQHDGEPNQDSHPNFDFLSLLSKPKNYYKILEVNYDASEDEIRANYIRLALKWHPDKQKGEDDATSMFQEINEAYQVLSDPVRRMEYDQKGLIHVYDYNIMEYLNRYKGLILTCNGLGIRQSIW